MNIENVHIETASREIRKNFEDKWVREDELFELFYIVLKLERTEDKRSERNLLGYLENRMLLETNPYRDPKLKIFKLTKKSLNIILTFYTMIYMGSHHNRRI